MTEPPASQPPATPNSTATVEEWVARLSQQDISNMSSDELVELIRSVRMPALRPDVNKTLPAYARGTLERLACLTQRYCRNRLRQVQREPRRGWLSADSTAPADLPVSEG